MQRDDEAQSRTTEKNRNVGEAAEKDVPSGSTGGNVGKRNVFSHCRAVTAGRAAGGGVLFSVFRSEADRVQHRQQVRIQALLQS